MRHYSKTTSHF